MKKDFREYLRLLTFLKPHLHVMILAAGSMLMFSVLNGLSPVALLPVIDNIISGKKIVLNTSIHLPAFVTSLVDKINSMPQMDLLVVILYGAFVYFLLRNLFDFLQTYLMTDVSQRVIRDMKDTLYKKMLSLSLSFYGRNPTAKLMARITYDTAVIRDAISTGVLDLILRPMEIIAHVTAVIMIVIWTNIPVSFLLTGILLFPAILLPAYFISMKLRRISTKTQEAVGDINTVLFEIITGIRIVKAFSMQDYEANKFKGQNHKFYKLEMKTAKRVNLISPINEFTSSLYFVSIIFLAGQQVVAGTLSFGALSVFLASIFLMVKPVKRLGKVFSVILSALAATTRIFDILDTKPEIEDSKGAITLPQIKENILVEDVTFRYLEENVLKNVSLEIKKGDIVAIVGPSGSGKSTLLNLLPRFYDPNSGKITIDGIGLKDVTLKSLRDQIGIVTQESLLFNDTVFNNISYGTSALTKEDVVRAAKVANAHEFIMNMPMQYDTVIGERGFKISGGERQRLAIARAIYKNPAILIFDEATSQLDTENERLVQEAIDRLMEGRTVLVVAHRISTITHANKIIVFDHGRIVETGAHKELLAKGGLYKRLYEMQFNERKVVAE